jgi:ArsR family transcriptional regulator
METAVQIDLTEDQVLLIAKALADPRRYEVLKRLADCALSCETMRACLDISPATLSHHMKELSTAGLVESERKGKFVHYALRRDVLEAYFARLRSDLL